VSAAIDQEVQRFMDGVIERSPNETVFHQAVKEVVESVLPYIMEHPEYRESRILERLTEPDRVVSFRVCWQDDDNETQINRGYRVQFTNALGPYKGGLRFHPTVTQDRLKFLAFEQVFKNSLTGLPMGAGKGGSNFDPKGKSDSEVMRFCQAFMTELCKYIGADRDVPAGDIGVGGREIGYLFGQYKRVRGEFEGVLTGKALEFGGSLIRPEATGYGTLYFAENMLEHAGDSMEGKVCTVSGSGNVAQYATEKALEMGAKVVSLSDSAGTIYDPDGIDSDKLAFVMHLKNVQRGRIKEYTEKFAKAEYRAGALPWEIKCDVALPCATENEIDREDAQTLVKNGCKVISEGANMPSTPEAIDIYLRSGVLYGLGKAANAGGVAVSGLEMSQNAERLQWTREEVDTRLKGIMKNIHDKCVEFGTTGRTVDYIKGANIAGFKKVADALLAQGVH
jgi:glutamate dehydrogenase/leucine dehydrogenase